MLSDPLRSVPFVLGRWIASRANIQMLQDVHQFHSGFSSGVEMLASCYLPMLWRSSPGRGYIRRDPSRVERGM